MNMVDGRSASSSRCYVRPRAGSAACFGQFSEQSSIWQLAEIVQKAGAEVGTDLSVQPIENPRFELEEHYYNATHTKLLDLGLKPTLLGETLMSRCSRPSSSRTRRSPTTSFRVAPGALRPE